MLLSKVAEHVTIVTVHVPTEDFDAVLRAELVHAHHQVSGAACEAHLRTARTTVSSQEWILTKVCCSWWHEWFSANLTHTHLLSKISLQTKKTLCFSCGNRVKTLQSSWSHDQPQLNTGTKLFLHTSFSATRGIERGRIKCRRDLVQVINFAFFRTFTNTVTRHTNFTLPPFLCARAPCDHNAQRCCELKLELWPRRLKKEWHLKKCLGSTECCQLF